MGAVCCVLWCVLGYLNTRPGLYIKRTVLSVWGRRVDWDSVVRSVVRLVLRCVCPLRHVLM